jgi:ATP-dependent DNA helicase Rep
VFETALRAQGIPYDISGGQSLFDRTEIKDIVAYLRLIANDDDDPAFLRAVTTPKRGVGQTTLARLADVSAARKESLFAAAFAPELRGAGAREAARDAACVLLLVNNLRFRAEREPAAACSTSCWRRPATKPG